MSTLSDAMEGDEFQDMDMDDLDQMEDMDDLDFGMNQEKSMLDKVSEIAFQDTSGKSLSSYNLEEYGFMPDSQGSQRILRALDCAIGHLDTVITDLVIGFIQISKDMNTGA